MKLRLPFILFACILLLSACQKEEEQPVQYDTFVPQVKALSGAFSVSASTQVQFAQGNLIYRTYADWWSTAADQYEIIGADNNRLWLLRMGWIDLFGWGTGDNPMSMSLDTNDFVHYAEWGDHFEGGWRTLSEDEWDYLLFYRANAAQRLTTATVCSVRGLLLLPDEWHAPSSVSVVVGTFDNVNVYSHSQFQVLERKGAVFLPATGYRQAQQYSDNDFNYWTSSSVGVRGYEGQRVFLDMDLSQQFVGLRGVSAYCGMAVRLVKNINEN